MAKRVTHYEAGYLYNRIKEQINAGDKEAAIQLVDTLYAGSKSMHDGQINMLSIMFTFIAEKLGEDAVGEVWQRIGDAKMKPLFNSMKAGTFTYETYRDFIRRGEMCHFSDFTEVEDDEKVDFIMHNCGVCGRLMAENRLDIQPEPSSFKVGTVKEPHGWCLGYTGMPYYCCHAPLYFNILGKQCGYDAGDYIWGKQFEPDGIPVDEPCHEILYRLPKDKAFHAPE